MADNLKKGQPIDEKTSNAICAGNMLERNADSSLAENINDNDAAKNKNSAAEKNKEIAEEYNKIEKERRGLLAKIEEFAKKHPRASKVILGGVLGFAAVGMITIGSTIRARANPLVNSNNPYDSSYFDQNKQDSNKAIEEDDKEQEQEKVELEAQDPGEKTSGQNKKHSGKGEIKDKIEVTKKGNDPTKAPAKAETTTGSKENKIVDNTPSEKTEQPSGSTNYQKGMEDKNKGAQAEANEQRAGGDASRNYKQETQPQKEIKSEEAKSKETPAETKSVTPQTPAPEVEKPSQNNYTMDEDDLADLFR